MEQKKLTQISQAVTNGYQKLEDTVVGGYNKLEAAVVEGYTKVEDAFVERYLVHEGETVAEAKTRLRSEQN